MLFRSEYVEDYRKRRGEDALQPLARGEHDHAVGDRAEIRSSGDRLEIVKIVAVG